MCKYFQEAFGKESERNQKSNKNFWQKKEFDSVEEKMQFRGMCIVNILAKDMRKSRVGRRF